MTVDVGYTKQDKKGVLNAVKRMVGDYSRNFTPAPAPGPAPNPSETDNEVENIKGIGAKILILKEA